VIAGLAFCGCTESPDETQSSDAASSDGDASNQQARVAAALPSGLRFRARREGTGLDPLHCSGISDERYFPALNGSGVAALDIDLDGCMDLLFATSTPIPIPATSDQYLTRLYRNHGGWSFSEVTSAAGGGYDGFAAGVTAADFDNDGFTDFYLNCLGPNRLYQNQGDGTFQLRSGPGIPEGGEFGTSSAFADLDGDSVLDLFVCNYGDWSPETNKWCGDREKGIRAFCAPDNIDPVIDSLYRGRGDGTFEDITQGSVVADRNYRSQGVIATHLNSDHLIDLYIGSDAHPNCLYVNQGGLQLDEVAQATGAAFDRNGVLQASMGIASADYDRNRSQDLFVTNYTREHNALYRGLGNGLFLDDARTTGVMEGAMLLVGWGVGFSDFDSDGWEDLMVVNGHTDTYNVLGGEIVEYEQPTLVYRNVDGRFTLQNNCIENEQESIGSSRGMTMLDVDLDLDVDVVFTNQDAQPGVLENTTSQAGESVAIMLVGTVSNRSAIGARIVVDGERPIVRVIQGGGSYLSTNSPVVLIPVGDDGTVDVTVTWPNGGMQSSKGLSGGKTYLLREAIAPSATMRRYSMPVSSAP